MTTQEEIDALPVEEFHEIAPIALEVSRLFQKILPLLEETTSPAVVAALALIGDEANTFLLPFGGLRDLTDLMPNLRSGIAEMAEASRMIDVRLQQLNQSH